MPEAEKPIPASPNFEKLKAKLGELFELDKADLDFGIYRVLRQRHNEIVEFLDKHLEKSVRAALTSYGELQNLQLKQDLVKAEAAAQAAGIAAEQSPRVVDLRSKLAKGADLDATADEIYSHILTFFSRYYQEGDFLGLQRSTVHGREKYVIPYNGEEVKLVWANMDQYYIKSSELLRDYAFRIRKADILSGELPLGDLPDEVIVQFKLVEGDTEKDNRKPDGRTTRAFALDAHNPFEENGNTLCVRFRYREIASERNLQDKLNADTEKTLADSLPPRWKALLLSTASAAKSKDKPDTRTILQHHLRGYTTKYQFDYFIHKDLGAFLRRELDFYLKNEVMYLDDIEEAGAPKAEEYLSKIRAIRRCAMPVIQMVAQLEDFQKKLWLKKKIVVETRYCLTLDRVSKALYSDICANDAQWQEWDDLYALSVLKPKRTSDFLKENPHLMLDTRHFSREFTLKLIASIEDLDASLDGVCFHSDNFQALQLMQQRYRDQVRCIYIDPPYNTDASPIMYKNGYKSSTWISLIKDRLDLARELLNKRGDLVAAIDDEQQRELSFLLSDVFQGVLLGTICVRANPSGRPTKTGYSVSHEYLIIAGKSKEAFVGRLPATDEQMARFSQEDADGVFEWRNLRREGSNSDRAARRYLYYPIYISLSNSSIRVPQMLWDEKKEEWIVQEKPLAHEKAVLPDNDDGEQKTWRWEGPTVMDSLSQLSIRKDRGGRDYIYYRRRPHEDGVVSVSSWFDAKYSATEHGTALLKDLFGKSPFSYPKSIHAVVDSVYICGASQRDSITVDFFGGSGTTAHAITNLNRRDHGNRKYLIVEMGEYFDTVLIPRIKKVVYSTDWKEGTPQTRDTGLSHAFKIVRLEGYEDTLNNLRLRRTPEQDAALAKGGEAVRDQYMLSYFLDVESAGSKSLLDLAQFRDPFAYKLNIATSSAGETRETAVDLVETFNWLLGLKVKHMDFAKGFLTVTGEKREGGRTLILWRTLSSDPVADNAALDKFLAKLAVNPADTEFEFIYLNGAHTLIDPHNRVHLIEETFKRLMFDTPTFESIG